MMLFGRSYLEATEIAGLNSLQELLVNLTDSRLIKFVRAWDAARGADLVPRWKELDIGLMASSAPWIWAWEYDRGSGVFRGKLAGEEIINVLGRGFRGALGHEYFADRGAGIILARYRQIILDRVGLSASGRVFAHAGSSAVGQTLILPVATRSQQADTVLGVTVYQFPPPAIGRVKVIAGTEEFFTLE